MEYKPDFEELEPYFQTFWNGEVGLEMMIYALSGVLDRGPVSPS